MQESSVTIDDVFGPIDQAVEPEVAQAPVEPAVQEPVEPVQPLTADEFLASLDSIDRNASKAILAKDPVQANRERVIANQMETTWTDAENNLDEYEAIANQNAVREQLKGAPVLSSFLASNERVAPIMRNDLNRFVDIENSLQKFGVVQDEEGRFELTADAETGWQAARKDVVTNVDVGFTGGVATGEQGVMWSKARDGKIQIDEEFKRKSAEFDKDIEAMQGNDSFIASAAQIVGTMYSSLVNSANETAWQSGAAVGAGMALGVAAPAVAPLLGAMTLGGSVRAMYDIEGGLAYKEMIEKGADVETAKAISRGVGLVNSLIEFGGITLLGKAVAPLLRTVVGQNTAKVASALAEPSMLAVVREGSKTLVKGTAAEVTTEVMQELVNVAGEGLASEFAGATFDEVTIGSLYDRLSDIAIQTMKGMVVLGGLGMIPTVVAGAKKVNDARKAEEFFTSLNDSMADSESRQLNPEMVEQAVDTMANEVNIESVYVDAEEFRQAIIDHGITPEQLEESLPGIAETLDQKAMNKEDLVFTTGQYAAKIAGTELGQTLVKHVRLHQEDLSVADAVKVQAEQRRIMKAIQDGTLTEKQLDKAYSGLSDEYKQQYDELKTRMYQQLEETGAYENKQELQTNAKFGAWMVTNFARRARLTPDQIAKLAPSVVSARKEETASFDDAVKQSLLSDPWKNAFIRAKSIIEFVLNGNNTHGQTYVETLPVSDELIEDLQALGFKGNVEGYSHALYDSDIQHIIDTHGEGNETSKDQIGLTKADLLRLPIVVGDYDTVELAETSKRGSLRIRYTRVFDDGVAYVVEEVRKKKKVLAVQTAYKKNVSGLRATSGKITSRKRPKRAEIDRSFDDILELFGESYNQSTSSSKVFEPDQNLIKKAKQNFGVTKDPKEAFYVLPDGAMLDGSGRHWGGSEVDVRGQRQVDHGDVSEILDSSGAQAMYEFMAKTGAMRFDANAGIASVAQAPTTEQISVLAKTFRGDFLALSLNTPEGRIVNDTEMESASTAKIKQFFDDAIERRNRGEQGAYAQEEGKILGSYSPSMNRISITPNANLSTFAHEMGHWYLETLISAYEIDGVSNSIKQDVEVMLKDFGLDSVQAWYALTPENREVLHERFAFYVEQYLATGQAPTKESRGFFARFGKWIRSVYERFGGETEDELSKLYRERFDVDLPPMSEEVRRVLDRMIAAESAIKTAEAAEGIMPLFQQKPADMTDESWAQLMQEYDDANTEATDKFFARMARDEKWFGKARSAKLREIQKQAEEVRNEVRAKVEKEVDERPEMKLFNFIKDSNMRLYEQDLFAQGVPQKHINILRRHGLLVKSNEQNRGKYAPTNTATLRQWASFIQKYDSNRKFVNDLLIACDREKLIDDLTTQRCLKENSELFDEKKRDALIAEAIHNEARSRLVATELSYLANDKEGRSRIYREAARRVAEQMIMSMPIGSVTVRKFVSAEARASRKAAEAFRRGDRYSAVLAKRAQLVQHEAALMAIEIEKEMRAVKNLKTRIFKADKKLAKTHDIDIVNIARYVLTNEGLGKTSPEQGTPMAAVKYVDRLKKYDPEKYATFSAMLDKHGFKGNTDFSKLSVEYAMEVIEDVQNLYRMARNAKQVMLDGKRLDRQETVNELVERFNSVERTEWDGGTDRVVSASQKLDFHWMNLKSKMIRIESWCHAMDGESNGPFFHYIYLPISNAASKFRNLNTNSQEALVNVLKPMINKWDRVREIEAPELGYTFATKAELIGAILHTGNQSNKHKMLLGGRGEGKSWANLVELADGSNFVDTSRWDAFFARCVRDGIITKEDMDTVQAIWDLTESTKPVAQSAFKQMYGTYFEEIEATEVVTPWGNYRGGYVPAITDTYLVADKQSKDEAKRITEQDFVSQMPVHQPGFSKSRVPNYTKPLALDVGLLCGHVQEVLKFAVIAPVAQEVGKIIADKKFTEAIDKHNPTWVSQMLVPWLKRSYEQTVSDGKSDLFSNRLNQLRGIAGMNIMAGHIVNALQQWTGLSIAATKVSPRYMMSALGQLTSRQVSIAEIQDMSEFMRARLNDRSFEFQSQVERIAKTTENVKQAKGALNKAVAADEKFDAARDWINRHGYFLQTAMQAPIDSIVWMGAYMEAMDNGSDQQNAIAHADSVVRTTQSAFDPESVAGVETGSALYRCFLVFYNYFNMQLNLLGESWEGAKHTKKYGKFALDVMYIAMIPSILSAILTQMVTGFDTGDDDEWDTYDAMRLLIGEPLKNVIAMAPFLGGAINSAGAGLANADVAWAKFVWGDDPYQGRLLNAPAFDAIGAGGSSLLQWLKAAEGEDFNARSAVRGTLDILSVVTRMPFGALKKPLGYVSSVVNDDIQPESPTDVVRGVLLGRDTNE